ncbi:MAG: hypothetical protein EAZ57_01085 [Cytophagales bacterium]|nr:MAG: hypothetical protein EAZ67_00045 [Cytophagales bacterium]TAF62379.1 MAG: hypothetical protein EAZ57_01085 [Cytophagales bacterium]
MKERFDFIRQLLSKSESQQENALEEAQKHLKAIEKEMNVLQFKFDRTIAEKTTLSNFLTQITKDYEKHILELNQAKEFVEHSLEKLTSGLAYAKRIQKAVLGDTSQLKNLFPNSFLIYKPRDVISGDFFWTTHLQNTPYNPEKGINSNSLKVVVAADCTGHGVSGAFLTLIGITHVNDIIKVRDVHQPHQILDELDSLISISLHENATNEQIRDGMDIGITVIDNTNKKAYFSGAKHSLFMLRNGEMKRFRGDNHTIDGRALQRGFKKFTLYSFDIETDDVLFMFTDGAADQFGGKTEKGPSRKLTSKKFREMLLSTSCANLSEQKEKIQQFLAQWRGDEPQTDDVLIMGIKV